MTDQAQETSQAAPGPWEGDHARRYMEARYGQSVWFRAPETFDNTVERWIWAVASGAHDMAEEQIAAIEAHFAAKRNG